MKKHSGPRRISRLKGYLVHVRVCRWPGKSRTRKLQTSKKILWCFLFTFVNSSLDRKKLELQPLFQLVLRTGFWPAAIIVITCLIEIVIIIRLISDYYVVYLFKWSRTKLILKLTKQIEQANIWHRLCRSGNTFHLPITLI